MPPDAAGICNHMQLPTNRHIHIHIIKIKKSHIKKLKLYWRLKILLWHSNHWTFLWEKLGSIPSMKIINHSIYNFSSRTYNAFF